MAVIEVEGLGKVEIQGKVPTQEEKEAIYEKLNSLESEDVGATDTIIPELITPELSEEPKLQGLEYIGGRPTFESIGAIGGGVIGTPAGLPGIVGGGTLGAAGAGQTYDILQSFITEEPTNFGTQVERAKKDFQREAFLQTIFAKIPGSGTAFKRLVFGKPDKKLYEAAKRLNFPLSYSDAGNRIAKGYGRVIGVFPYVGQPIKKAGGAKANIINKTADDTLNTFAPNVSLTKLGLDMTEASKSTYGSFRRISGYFYDDFYKTTQQVKSPIIPTKTFKNSLNNYVKLVNEGDIKIFKQGKVKTVVKRQENPFYKYAQSAKRDLPEFINANQYRALVKDIQNRAIKAQKDGFVVSSAAGFKAALEKDLAQLTKKQYLDGLVKRKIINAQLAPQIKTKLDFANKVYAQGLENTLITNAMKKQAAKADVNLKAIPGIGTFQSPVAKKFKMVDKNIFGAGFQVPGSITADNLGSVLIANKNLSPMYLNDLRNLVGKTQFNKFARKAMDSAYEKSLISFREPNGINGLMFDPYKFEDALGLNTTQGRDLLKGLLKDTKLSIDKLDDFFVIAKNHASLTIPDVSNFIARRATLGGTKSLFGGFAMGYSTYREPIKGLGMIYLARKGSGFLANPKQLDDVMTVLDPKSDAFQVKMLL